MNNNQDAPAFPTSDTLYPNGQIQLGSTGLSKREYFAALAMQGLLSCDTDAKHAENAVAVFAVTHADSLIEELNK